MTVLHPIFTPTAADPAWLESVTVGRRALLSAVVDRLRLAATTGNRTHTLVIGPRGSGKTHVLTVALQRALSQPSIADRLAIAWVPEDVLAIGSYRDLLVELVSQLRPGLAARARLLRGTGGDHDVELLLREAAAGRTIVLVVENLDRVFASLGTTGASGLRGFVETDGLLLLASAPLLFPAVQRREEPWFGSFNVEILPELTLDEGTEIVRRRAVARGDSDLAAFVATTAGQARLQVIRGLAGGSPRLWHLLAETVDVASLDQLLPAVDKLLDDLAPYYQQRLWELSPGEQKLVVELARQDGMQPVAELAAAAGTSERATATGLGRLAEARWVRKQKSAHGDQRKTWYELRDPLLRRYLQFRERRGGEPLRLVVEILRSWYGETERPARDWLLRYGGDSNLPSHLALAMNGDAEALLRLGPELRALLEPQLLGG